MKYDTVIIGAGAAGLMAAIDLSKAGKRICVLEAAAQAGGRMATKHGNGFSMPVETGAEFVHGNLPLTLELLNEAGIPYLPVEGEMVSVRQGKWNKHEAHDKYWGQCMRQLKKIKTDMSIDAFLQQYFAGEKYTRLRDAVRRFASGFDLADTADASALAASLEWNQEEETQYRIPGGYCQLVDYLQQQATKAGVVFHFNSPVNMIRYKKNTASAIADNGDVFEASAILVTVSAGVLQSGQLHFEPLPDTRYTNAFGELGFGDVIKVLLEFDAPFWNEKADDTGFIISDEKIPTWWTQLPLQRNLLTGWLGGPPATARSQEDEASLLRSALESLSNIFAIPVDNLQLRLKAHAIHRWNQHAFINGGYSYIKTGSADAKRILSHPLSGLIFFAGEALYQGQSQGTVEAALQSGRSVAAHMIQSL